MSEAASSKLNSEHSESAHYFLEVVRVEGIRKNVKKGELYVEIKVDNVVHRTGRIKDGRPSSEAIHTFSQSGPHSAFSISLKHSRKRSQDRLLGQVTVKEDVAKLLQGHLPYEFKCDLAGAVRKTLGSKRSETTTTVHLRLHVLDAWARAELCVSMAERSLENMRTWADRVGSGDSVFGPIIQAVDQIIKVVGTVMEIHPLFDLSWKAASALYKLVSYQFSTDAKLVDMIYKMREAFRLSIDARILDDRTEILKPIIEELLDETANCARAVQKYSSHGFIGRIAHWPDGKKIEDYACRFMDLRQRLLSAVHMNIAKGVDNLESRQMLQLLQMQLELPHLDTSKVSTRPRCLEGTRRDYINQTVSKLFHDSGPVQNIVWLTGAAGAGKSTIAVTISDLCDERGCPAAYLFFERGKDEYMSAVRAIAYRLAALHPLVCSHIVNAVRDNSNIVGSQLKTQFEKLLLGPIQAAANGIEHPIIIILDALDECGTNKQREDLVRLLTADVGKLSPRVRVLVTSRPESDILKHLLSKSHIHHIELEHTSQGSRRDVASYIKERMTATVEQGPPRGREWDEIFSLLSDAADGLFIWASTAIKMVGDSNNPRRKLRMLLDDVKSVGGGIDSLYATVLEQSGIPWHEPEASYEFVRILGVILFAKEAMSGEDIEAFLGLEEDTADTVLCRLRSVLSYEYGRPVRLHHASFADYLTSERSSGKPWNIDEVTQRRVMAERCFDVMSEHLRFNICGIESSFMRNDDIPDLHERTRKAIPWYLNYACRFWSVHFCEIPSCDGLLKKLKHFAGSHLLYWFEVLSLTAHYDRVAGQALLNSTLRTATTDAALSSFLWAAYKTAVTFGHPISQSAPHIYLSAISLWRGESLVADHYSQFHPAVNVHRYGKKPPAQCIKVLTGHTRYVRSVVFSSDGKRIVSGSSDHTIRIWDVHCGEVKSNLLRGHTGEINSVAFSSDGQRIASCSDDATICIWDVNSGELSIPPLKGHTGRVWSVEFSPDGRRIVSGSEDMTIRMWDADSGRPVGDPRKGHTKGVISVMFSPSGRSIASGSDDRTIRIWDSDSGKLVSGLFHRYAGLVWSMAFSPDGRCIASVNGSKSIHTWDIYTGRLSALPIIGHTDGVCSVAFSPDGRRIVSGSYDSTICVRDADSGELVAGPFRGHTLWVRSVTFSPDGKCIASGSADKRIRIWDAESGRFDSRELKEHSGPVNSISFSPNGKYIASGSDDCTVCVWETDSGKLVSGPLKGHTNWTLSVAFSPNGRHIASGSDACICVWDAETGELVSGPCEGHTSNIWSVAFSPSGEQIVSGSHDKTIRVWNVDTGELAAGPFEGHTGGVRSVLFSPNGKHIVSGSEDKSVRVWDAENGKLVMAPIEGHTNTVWSVAYSADGERIASVSKDRRICVWKAGTGELLLGPLKGHTDEVNSVAFSPNGKHIITGSDDKTIRVWNAYTGELVSKPLCGHTDEVSSVAFSPEGKYLASGSIDGTIRLWTMDNIHFMASRPDSNIATPDRGFGVDKNHIVSNSTLSKDGWLLGPQGELLIWIPEDMRSTLILCPENLAVIGQGFSTSLDLLNSPLGEEWCRMKLSK